MSETGKNVIAAVAQFRKLYCEIGRLLEHADEQMKEHGWKARGNRSVMSKKILQVPQEWLPVVMLRLYDNAQRKNLLGFVSVVLDDHDGKGRITEPLISAGWCDYGTGKRAKKGYLAGWADCHVEHPAVHRADDGTVVIREDKEWLEPEKYGVVRYGSLALPLVSVTNAEDLRKRIVSPLLTGIEKAGKIGV